ncbi:MAG: hypothetical protein ACEPO8_09135 [Rhodothermaceae bacterium]
MTKVEKVKTALDTVQLKLKAIEKCKQDLNIANASTSDSEVTVVNNEKIVIIRDFEKKILAHYQLQENGSLFKLP